jgi:hypothetical protein
MTRDAIEQMLAEHQAGFLARDAEALDPPRAAVFWQFEGTAAGPFFGDVRPGTVVRIAGAGEYAFSEAGITAVRHIFDFSAVLVSAGVLRLKPA